MARHRVPLQRTVAAAAEPGFSLLELIVVIAIAGLVLAVSAPASIRLYESVRHRQAVREVTTLLSSARYAAVRTGRAADVGIDPDQKRVSFGDLSMELPEGTTITVRSAREVNRPGLGVIRFYPEGGSSGGDVDIGLADGVGVRISVDWLVGRVTQQRYAVE